MWILLSTPHPAAATFGGLKGVECTGVFDCIAVGGYGLESKEYGL